MNNTNTDCPICLDPITHPPVSLSDCNHKLNYECAKKLLGKMEGQQCENPKPCPLCRKTIIWYSRDYVASGTQSTPRYPGRLTRVFRIAAVTPIRGPVSTPPTETPGAPLTLSSIDRLFLACCPVNSCRGICCHTILVSSRTIAYNVAQVMASSMVGAAVVTGESGVWSTYTAGLVGSAALSTGVLCLTAPCLYHEIKNKKDTTVAKAQLAVNAVLGNTIGIGTGSAILKSGIPFYKGFLLGAVGAGLTTAAVVVLAGCCYGIQENCCQPKEEDTNPRPIRTRSLELPTME